MRMDRKGQTQTLDMVLNERFRRRWFRLGDVAGDGRFSGGGAAGDADGGEH